MPKPKNPGWNDCKKTIANWPHKGLMALVQELFQLSDDNRRFLIARLAPQQQAVVLEEAKKKIVRLYRGYASLSNRFSSRDVYRVLDQFAKAVDDGAAVTELTIAAMAAGLEVFMQFGGGDESMVDHLYVLLGWIRELLPYLEPESQEARVRELMEVSDRWTGAIGYGLADEIDGETAEWCEKLGIQRRG
jgi:hypothetical protein